MSNLKSHHKIIAFVLIFACVLVGCGKIETIDDPKILICSIHADEIDKILIAEDELIYQDFDNVNVKDFEDLADFYSYIQNNSVDILHIIVRIDPGGTITGKPVLEVMEYLEQKDLKLIIFARDVSSETFDQVFDAEKTNSINMNFIVTLNRRGENFGLFFGNLFTLMADGDSFMNAWITLAPQTEGPWMEKAPSTIAVPNRGDFKLTN